MSRHDPRTEVIPGYRAAETVILAPVGANPAGRGTGAGRRAARPAGAQRLVRWAERHHLARLLHLDAAGAPCRALVEVWALTERQAQRLALARLAAEPSLPRAADMRTALAVDVRRLDGRRWHVQMEFLRKTQRNR